MGGHAALKSHVYDLRNASLTLTEHIRLPDQFIAGDAPGRKIDPHGPVGQGRAAGRPIGHRGTNDLFRSTVAEAFNHVPVGNLHPGRSVINGEVIGDPGVAAAGHIVVYLKRDRCVVGIAVGRAERLG